LPSPVTPRQSIPPWTQTPARSSSPSLTPAPQPATKSDTMPGGCWFWIIIGLIWLFLTMTN
jgi:hypothetical protein